MYASIGTELFNIDKLRDLLAIDERKAILMASLMRKSGCLAVFDKEKRRRLYRLADPESYVLALAMGVDFSLGRYHNLALNLLRELHFNYTQSLTSVILFGSIARGRETKMSDFDVLVISDFSTPYLSRIEELTKMEYKSSIGKELSWLKNHGVFTHISWFPLSWNEAKVTRPLYFDLVEDAVPLYDKERFFEKIISNVKLKMLEKNSRRVWIGKNKWYWVIDPNVKIDQGASF